MGQENGVQPTLAQWAPLEASPVHKSLTAQTVLKMQQHGYFYLQGCYAGEQETEFGHGETGMKCLPGKLLQAEVVPFSVYSG